ncbi:MAG TPA: hypothetical protein VKC60_00520 [Opitutaceae bacterium]|nr:hypothetical protein [Opitutaceae bacterium]
MVSNKQLIQDRADAWRRVNAALVELQKEELPALSTAVALRHLAPAFEQARRQIQNEPWSGLVEQQSWFRKLHGR